MRRVRANWIRRLKAGRTFGVGTVLSLVAVWVACIGCISAAGVTIAMGYQAAGFAACVAIGSVVAYVRGRMKLLPDCLIDDMSSDGAYECRYISGKGLREACELTRPYYRHEYVPGEIAEQWRVKNPHAFVEITNAEGVLCASFGIIGLVDSFFDQFVAGRLTDMKATADDILDSSATNKAARLYISGVVVRDSETYCGHKRARVMLWCMVVYCRRILGKRGNIKLYALAVTPDSERLLKGVGFSLASAARDRADKCNLYSFVLDERSLVGLECRVGDLSKMCSVEFLQRRRKLAAV